MNKLSLPQPGDILPAQEAIEMIPQVDLGSPIDIPEIPANAYPEDISEDERQFYSSEIARFKRERNALVLAHNYEVPDVQKVADNIGDSLHLAKVGRDSKADVIVEASVLFMNQILAIMKRPRQKVLAPSLKALCSLAAHADPNKILSWKQSHPNGIVVSYVNTYIEVKALSDYCCASANSTKVIQYVIENESGPILFLPDIHLGFFAVKLLEKMRQPINRLWLMMGACHVHDMIRPYHINQRRKEYSNAATVIHPECGCTSACMRQVNSGSVAESMMQFRSTWGMVDYAKSIPQKEIIVATEAGNIYPLSVAMPNKKFIAANPEAVCAFMKQNTLKNLYESLRDMKHVITVDPELAEKARKPIERMLTIS